MTKSLLMTFLLWCTCFADIVFQRESVTAAIIACDTLEIQGIYYFVNSDTSTMETPISYPLPADSMLAYPHFISVVRLSNRQKVPFEKKEDAVIWNQTILPHSTDSMLVTYRQKVRQAKGRYILTTTRYWKRPLEKAAFSVITPDDITLTYWSFPSDSVSMRNGRIHYFAEKKDFLPESDMLLEWNCGNK